LQFALDFMDLSVNERGLLLCPSLRNSPLSGLSGLSELTSVLGKPFRTGGGSV
jgi:hypothetical protein